MASEFLSRLSNIQGSMFRNTIQAKALELVNNKVESTKSIVDTAASEMALLRGSASMKSIDEQIDELSKRPEVISGTEDIADLSKRAAMLSEVIAQKESAEGEIYDKVTMSLGVVGGDSATRALNAIARQQDKTNKELDSKIDAIDLQVKRQSVYTSAVLNTKQLKQIELDEEHSRLVDIAYESFLADPDYIELQDLHIEKSNRQGLEAYETAKSALIEKHFGNLSPAEKGMTRKILEDAFGVANLYSGKFASGKTGPQSQEELIDLRSGENTLKEWTAMLKMAGGLEVVKNIVQDPDQYTPEAVGMDSDFYNALRGIFVNPTGGPSRYDVVAREVMAQKDLSKTVNLQQELRKKAEESGSVIPPGLDMPLYVNADPGARDYLVFNGGSARFDLLTGPESAANRQKEIDLALGENRSATFERTITGGKEVVSTPKMFSMTGGFPSGFSTHTAIDDTGELANWQKVTNAWQALKNDKIPDELQQTSSGRPGAWEPGFEDLAKQRRAIYASRKDPVTSKYMPYVEPVAKLKSNVDFSKSAENAEGMLPWEPAIVGASSKHDLPQDQLRSIIHHESAYGNPNAKSYTNVKGLAQITGDTLSDIVNKWKLVPEGWTEDMIKKNPEMQVYAGAAYLDYMRDTTFKNLSGEQQSDAMMLGYNAGPKRVLEFMEYGIFNLIRTLDVSNTNKTSYDTLMSMRKDFNTKYGSKYTEKTWDEKIGYLSRVDNDYKRDFVTIQGNTNG